MLRKDQEVWWRYWTWPSREKKCSIRKAKKKKLEEVGKNDGTVLFNSYESQEPFVGSLTLRARDSKSFSEKNIVRGHLLEERLSLPLPRVIRKSKKIAERVLSLGLFEKAKSLALYYPIRNEVRTERIFEKARSCGKEVYFPRVRGKLLEFLGVDDLAELEVGRFGIPESPPNAPKIKAEKLDLIIIPGVAFDRLGSRMGYGKGFYDRTLEGIDKQRLLGLAYDFQVLCRVPTEEGDIGLGLLVTESGIIFA